VQQATGRWKTSGVRVGGKRRRAGSSDTTSEGQSVSHNVPSRCDLQPTESRSALHPQQLSALAESQRPTETFSGIESASPACRRAEQQDLTERSGVEPLLSMDPHVTPWMAYTPGAAIARRLRRSRGPGPGCSAVIDM
jgi:hypothetical protein